MEKSYAELRQEKLNKAVEMRAAGKSLEEIAPALKVSYRTIQRYWKKNNIKTGKGVKTSRN